MRANADLGGPLVAAGIYGALKASGLEDQAMTFASTGFDLSSEATRDGLGQMVAANVLTAEQAGAMLARARLSHVRCSAWGFSQVQATDLAKAANYDAYTLDLSRAQRIDQVIRDAWMVDGTVLSIEQQNAVE